MRTDPSKVMFSVARAGQDGYHHRTERNKKIYRIAKGSDEKSATTEFDIGNKAITPMGGFVRYGVVRSDFVVRLALARLLELRLHTRTDDQGLLCRRQEACAHPAQVSANAHVAQGSREDYAQADLDRVQCALSLLSLSEMQRRTLGTEFGHGRFQTAGEKASFLGQLKIKAQ